MDTMQVGNLDEHSSKRSHLKKDGEFFGRVMVVLFKWTNKQKCLVLKPHITDN